MYSLKEKKQNPVTRSLSKSGAEPRRSHSPVTVQSQHRDGRHRISLPGVKTVAEWHMQ